MQSCRQPRQVLSTFINETKRILAIRDSKADDRRTHSSAGELASTAQKCYAEKSYGSLQRETPGHATPSDRIVSTESTVSTFDTEIDSTGGDTILFSKELTTGIFCADLFSHLISKIWGKVVLEWVATRPDTRLAWADS